MKKKFVKIAFYICFLLLLVCHAILLIFHKNYLPAFGPFFVKLHNQVITSFAIEIFIVLIFTAIALLLKSPPKILIRLSIAGLVFLFTLFVYRTTALLMNYHVKPVGDLVYFPELAQAFINKTLILTNPSSTRDLTYFNGNWYVAFPPLAAILMLPSVARGGVESIDPVSFSTFWGALGIAWFWLGLDGLRQKGIAKMDSGSTLWLTALLGFGSAFYYITISSQIWFISHVLAVAFCCLAFWLATDTDHPMLVGLALAIGMLARPTIGITALFFVGILAAKNKAVKQNLKSLLLIAVKMALPMAAITVALLAYNYLRFQNWLDFGYTTMNVGDALKTNLINSGQFNISYFPKDFFYTFLAAPSFSKNCPYLTPSYQGMSLFIAMPVLFLLFLTFSKREWVIAADASILLSLSTLLVYFNTGASQFGNRFSLDYIVPLIAIFAVAAEKKKYSWLIKPFIILGIIINTLGAFWYFGKLC